MLFEAVERNTRKNAVVKAGAHKPVLSHDPGIRIWWKKWKHFWNVLEHF